MSIENSLAYSYIALVQKYNNILQQTDTMEILKDDFEFARIKKFSFSLLKNLSKKMNLNVSDKASIINEIMETRNKIEQIFLATYTLNLELRCKFMEITADKTYIEPLVELDQMQNYNFENIINDISELLFSITSSPQQAFGKNLLEVIPLGFKYASARRYIKESLKYVPYDENISNKLFFTLLGGFDATDEESKSMLKDNFEQIVNLDDDASYDEYYDDLEEILFFNDDYLDLLNDIFCLLGCICNLLVLENFDFDTLLELHPSFSDLYYIIKNPKQYNSIEISERIDMIEEELQEIYFESLDLDNPTEHIMHFCLSLFLDDLINFYKGDSKVHFKEIDMFLEELDKYVAKATPEEVNAKLQYILSRIPFTMNEGQFKTYLNNSFKNNDFAVNVFTVEKLKELLSFDEEVLSFINENLSEFIDGLDFNNLLNDTFLE
ncbi:hypothetical protein AN639_06910 [Candidatus Epulonipiscium fishelsonii]|uniref:Uncharacterized protein n=1 Tax=Candidatus Epulonipiscium fishelsonii TaxID=77094 RepID=A0ACC8XAV7_9FIRM|nr:hypothetical protein AN639_06910 [Epulopiscium sp. SCG-B05WGA-EpuloA1]ONI39661.1 hypothetical protein AN396_07850 [Epulopiscium sp. SCG-B11WGA-EpuloA1]